MRNPGGGPEAWLMPYPASAANPPRQVLEELSGFNTTPTFSWMPDNRQVLLSASRGEGPRQLYMADTGSGLLTAISSGPRAQNAPAVSPDGARVVFLESDSDYDVVSVDLATARLSPVIATQRAEQQPAWAARESAMAYVIDRNGASEIWLYRPGQPERPLVTPRDFPPHTTGCCLARRCRPTARG